MNKMYENVLTGTKKMSYKYSFLFVCLCVYNFHATLVAAYAYIHTCLHTIEIQNTKFTQQQIYTFIFNTFLIVQLSQKRVQKQQQKLQKTASKIHLSIDNLAAPKIVFAPFRSCHKLTASFSMLQCRLPQPAPPTLWFRHSPLATLEDEYMYEQNTKVSGNLATVCCCCSQRYYIYTYIHSNISYGVSVSASGRLVLCFIERIKLFVYILLRAWHKCAQRYVRI